MQYVKNKGDCFFIGLQTPTNRWNHKALGLVLSSVSKFLEPVIKLKARVFDMSS